MGQAAHWKLPSDAPTAFFSVSAKYVTVPSDAVDGEGQTHFFVDESKVLVPLQLRHVAPFADAAVLPAHAEHVSTEHPANDDTSHAGVDAT